MPAMRVDGQTLVLGFALAAAACAHSKIPNSDIDDTEENREVLAFVEKYEKAVESLNPDEVIALVSPDFYEDNGNTDSTDDYDYEELKNGLRESFGRTQTLRLDLRVDAVEVDDADAFAELYYEYRAKNDYPSGSQWDTGADRTRLQLKRDAEGRWRIVSGI